MIKNILIGNGINISEWPEIEWENFGENIDDEFFRIMESLKINEYGEFYYWLSTKIKKFITKEKSLDKKTKAFDLLSYFEDDNILFKKANFDFLKKLISKMYKLGLLLNFDEKDINDDTVHKLFKLSKLESNPQLYFELGAPNFSLFDKINDKELDEIMNNPSGENINKLQNMFLLFFGKNKIFLLFITLNNTFKLLKNIFLGAIREIILNKYDFLNKSYSKKRINWLSKFKKIITLNVDGVINKTNLNVWYPHGFFYPDGIKFSRKKTLVLLEQMTMNENQKEMCLNLAEKSFRYYVNPIYVTFSFLSSEKKVWGNIAENYPMNDNLFLDYFNSIYKKNDLEIDNVPKTRISSYSVIDDIKGTLVIYGLNYSGDEVIFDRIMRNKNITKIIVFCEDDKLKKIYKNIFGQRVIFEVFRNWFKV